MITETHETSGEAAHTSPGRAGWVTLKHASVHERLAHTAHAARKVCALSDAREARLAADPNLIVAQILHRCTVDSYMQAAM